MVWGGALGVVPADAKIIRVEKKLNIDPEAQLLASIMSKKLAMSSNHILIDIPYGKGAKVTKAEALNLKRKFKTLAKYYKKKLEVVLTNGSQPIGNGIGPILELRDVIAVLQNKQDAPKDLKRKSLFLSAKLLELTGKAKKGQGLKMAKQILESNKALEKFKEIIKAQKGSFKIPNPARFKKEISSKKSGKILEINNKKINHLARLTGAPNDKASGLFLHCLEGKKVKRGDKLLAIYSQSKSRLRQAIRFYNKERPIKIH
jgi:thymidine phosphorylase